ncbi:hypothetical protein KAFR_0L02090 [Kazachstania africana CBS 2517]|uniref:Uncharacterized protein n=1 Tax=Kazachstania africana (strain ATCC 22294 / BCRC 22015 / CBS 2517 / CECT 1963 / NBRC 1671 / NRRL Y-8276) TaxID=1071382 RepID=H2B2H0_KAZAF|nr:hypothetical protein KAFR_0L02090 [Kazachstania africana CBS 2517]CCF60820.1 hypothetical protein KAFR_0L02090 [Kazachstania africana CBS 2517]
MAKKSKSKVRAKSSKRALSALELAERELGENASSSETEDYNSSKNYRRNGTVVNLLKSISRKNEDEEEDHGSENDSFEDEELGSDEALGSDDDYDILNSKISQTIRDKKKLGEEADDLDEEAGYTSIDEDELMPLSQVWDADNNDKKSESDSDNQQLNLQDNMSSDFESESESESEESDEDEKEANPFDEISEDEEDVELNTITSKLLKDTSNHSKKLDNYGTGEENEFMLPSASTTGGAQKLSLSDMMNAIDDKEIIAKASLIDDKKASSTVNIPLPQRIQQRHDRKAAYEISKDEVNKWNDIVKQNRRAEHLSFPLNAAADRNESSAFTRNIEEPRTELEEKIGKVLKESNLVDLQKESTFEELATAKMTPEEMRKRTAEMRLMRELMFREERKAKRIKKIKSKAYHRIKKKEMLRNKELAGVSDESDTEHDLQRARERMTLKHKTNAKWAKDMIKHGMTNDAETREEMEEMLRQGERLRSKILDKNSDDEAELNISDLERDNADSGDESSKENLGKTGVMNMAFMKNADAREREANREKLARLRAAENGEDFALFDSDEDQETKTTGEQIQLNKGRRVYTPGNLKARKVYDEQKTKIREEIEIDASRSLTNRLRKANSKVTNDGTLIVEEEEDRNESEPEGKGSEKKQDQSNQSSNPWLDESDDEQKTTKRSSKISIVDKDSSKQNKSAQKIMKESEKQNRINKSKLNENQEEHLLSDSTKLSLIAPYNNDEDDDQSQGFMFKQQEVIAEAFAGDNVVAEFEEEKKRVAIDEDDKEEDVTLPGWGDWAGAGAQPRKKRKFIKKIKGTVEKDKRKDKNLKNVIINERVNKKNLKYQSSAVPFPFESREQYERSLRMPIGQEWTSRQSHQDLIKPRIMTKPGQVIDPLKNPFK